MSQFADVPGNPIWKKIEVVGRNDTTQTVLYLLEWDHPINSDTFDLDHYEVVTENESVIIAPNQQHVIVRNIISGTSAQITISAISRCGERSSTKQTFVEGIYQ